MTRYSKYLFILCCVFLLVSCSKGYEVRFTNYYTESMDSVILGSNKIVFTDIKFEDTTPFKKLAKGKHAITCISKSKKKFYSSFTIPSSGSGKRTVQIDGISQISILEE